jgi:uncharacterized membrane protein
MQEGDFRIWCLYFVLIVGRADRQDYEAIVEQVMGSYIRDCWDSGVRMYIQTGTVDCPSGHNRCFRDDDREFSGCVLVLQQEGRREMKFRKDKDILRFSCIAALLILAGIFMVSFLPGSTYFRIGAVLIIMGVIAIIIAMIAAATPKEDIIQDERSVRVNETAGYHAFWILLVTLALVQSIDMFWRLNLSYKSVSPDIFIVGMLIIIGGVTPGENQNQGTAGTIQPDAGGACEEGRGEKGDDCVSREGKVQSVAQAGT